MKHKNITCPFCGLVCDDLVINVDQELIKIEHGRCALNTAGLNQAHHIESKTSMIRGEAVSSITAVDRAASLLHRAEFLSLEDSSPMEMAFDQQWRLPTPVAR